VRDLEGAQQTLVEQFVWAQARYALARHSDPARGGRQTTGDDVEKGCLARPVGTD
jgi:hypothetical protein